MQSLPTRALLVTAVAAAVVAAILIHVGLSGTPATLAKLVASACLGLALASLLVRPLEVVMIALVIAAVDIYSVAAGPTHVIVEHHQAVLDAFTLAFHPPGSYGAAQIGASDFVFFAVFTGAAIRLHLRRRLTLAGDDRVVRGHPRPFGRLRHRAAGAAAAVAGVPAGKRATCSSHPGGGAIHPNGSDRRDAVRGILGAMAPRRALGPALLALVATAVLCAGGTSAQASGWTRLADTAPQWANAHNHVGNAGDANQLVFSVWLDWSHQSDLDALLAAQQNPASPQYGQWLTPAGLPVAVRAVA